jgi:hypothetical protein
MSRIGAAPRAAVPVSSARADASRQNGARSRGPKTAEGKARSALNALKHGMRAQKYVVLPQEDADEFAGLEAAMLEELAPVGALQTVLARRVAVAAWRLARADRIEVELFEERRFAGGGLGLALIRDGNGTRSFETLLRYRGAAMAEFWRALRTLKALQAEAAALPPVRGAVAESARVQVRAPRRSRPGDPAPDCGASQVVPRDHPIEPDLCARPDHLAPAAPPAPRLAAPSTDPARARPSEPKAAATGAVEPGAPAATAATRLGASSAIGAASAAAPLIARPSKRA